MKVITCTIELGLGGISSLKDKRRILKSVLARLSNQFNISVAEVDYHDVWQSAVIGIAAVGNDTGHLHSLMEKAVGWIERNRLDVYIVQYNIEFR